MTHLEIVDKLVSGWPGSHWILQGNTYDQFTWLDDPATKPSAADLGL